MIDRKLCYGHGEPPFINSITMVQSEASESTNNLEMGIVPLTHAKSRSPAELVDLVAIFVFMISHVIYNCIYFSQFI
jgi:hypothetical protein